MEKKIKTPLTDDKVKYLNSGDVILLSGYIYTARDAAHRRLVESLDLGEKLPFNIKDQIIYYSGPTPTKPGSIIGSAGPTTSYRMDNYTVQLLNIGLRGMIGKGLRSKEVIDNIIKNNAVYFSAIGGTAALITKSIVESEVIAYEDLDTESIRKLKVKDMPLIVTIDCRGNNLYEIGPNKYLNSLR